MCCINDLIGTHISHFDHERCASIRLRILNLFERYRYLPRRDLPEAYRH